MKLFDLKSLSERTSLSVFTYRKYIKLGMPHYRVGRKILVDPNEFEVWFQQFKAGSAHPPGNLDSIVDEAIGKMK